jgi:hypothetical protein
LNGCSFFILYVWAGGNYFALIGQEKSKKKIGKMCEKAQESAFCPLALFFEMWYNYTSMLLNDRRLSAATDQSSAQTSPKQASRQAGKQASNYGPLIVLVNYLTV